MVVILAATLAHPPVESRPYVDQPEPEPKYVLSPSNPARGGPTTSGEASYFGTGPDGLYAAAGPALRVGDWRGRRVRVWYGSDWVDVTLNDSCWCPAPDRIIDLSDEAFASLAPLWRGVIDVTVEVLP